MQVGPTSCMVHQERDQIEVAQAFFTTIGTQSLLRSLRSASICFGKFSMVRLVQQAKKYMQTAFLSFSFSSSSFFSFHLIQFHFILYLSMRKVFVSFGNCNCLLNENIAKYKQLLNSTRDSYTCGCSHHSDRVLPLLCVKKETLIQRSQFDILIHRSDNAC